MKAEWTTMKLADICELFIDGDWIETKDQSTNGVRLIQTGNIGEGLFKNRSEKARYISNETFKRLGCTEIFEGDCLISRLPDPVGRSCILFDTGERMITAVDCTIARFKRNLIIPKFFEFYSQSPDYLKVVNREAGGATRKRISRSKLGEITVPVPPLAEQRRIVAILDDAFENIAIAKTNSENNLQNSRALLKSHLQGIFHQNERENNKKASEIHGELCTRADSNTNTSCTVTNIDIPGKIVPGTTKTGGRRATLRHIPGSLSLSVGMPHTRARMGWRWTSLSELAKLESGHTPSRRHPEYWDGAIPWVGIQDARENHGRRIVTTFQYTNVEGIANSSARILPENTVCLSRTASVGYVVIMGRPMATSQDFVNWVCSSRLIPEFLMYLLLAEGREGLLRYASGAVHQTIYFPEAKAFYICHPGVEEQLRIVRQCDALREKSQTLASIYERKLARLAELKNSLLSTAFSGAL